MGSDELVLEAVWMVVSDGCEGAFAARDICGGGNFLKKRRRRGSRDLAMEMCRSITAAILSDEKGQVVGMEVGI